MRVMVISVGALLAALALASSASAQTGPCPTSNALSVIPIGGVINVCVIPAPASAAGGHNSTDPNSGLPIVTRYDILLLNEADPVSGPVQATIPIGKPPLNTDGVFWTVLPNASVPINRRFRATAVAFGQPNTTPSGRSALSNGFIVANPTNPSAPTGTAVP